MFEKKPTLTAIYMGQTLGMDSELKLNFAFITISSRHTSYMHSVISSY